MELRPVVLAIGVFGWAVGCASAPGTSPKADPPKKASAAKVVGQRASVTQTYNDNCSHCHGVNGEGGGAGTKSFLTRAKFDQSMDRPFFDAIKNGVAEAGMDSFGTAWNDETVWAMVVHIRELQSRALNRTDPAPMPNADGVTKTKLLSYRTETVLEGQGLRTPWAVDWLPDGTMLVTNRGGELMLARKGRVVATVQGTPEVLELGQGGLMQVKVHPQHAQNGWVYLTVADPAPNAAHAALTLLVRGKIREHGGQASWVDQQVLFRADPQFYTGAGIHFGSKIAFGPGGKLFFNIGERGANEGSRDLTNPFGKIFRLNDDGTVPADNPFRGRGSEVTDKIWTWGHRNPQGLAFGLDGRLWSTEHAPRGGDELNLVEPGKDYGWPVVGHGINYNDTPFHTPWAKPGITVPVYRWMPSCAASGLACVPGGPFSPWTGDLLCGGLAGQSVDRVRVKDGNLVGVETVWKNRGRVRDVAIGPDGAVYLVLNAVGKEHDRVVRLVPASP